jgi:hypothetical protein
MRRPLLLAAFAFAHVLALFGPLIWVSIHGPLLHTPPPLPAPTAPAPPALPDLSGVPRERLHERAELRGTWQVLALELVSLTHQPTALDPTKPRTTLDDHRDLKTITARRLAATAELDRRYPRQPPTSTLDVDLDIARLRLDIERMSVELNKVLAQDR